MQLIFPAEGTYTVVVAATDEAGNSVSATRNIIYAIPINGVCGSSNSATLTVAPTTNLCTTGSATSVTGTGPWNWSCSGSNGGTTASCSASIYIAPAAVNGVCGAANGTTVASTPTTNLCTTGSATSVTGVGPWSWSCSGSNGGSNTGCSAILPLSGVLVPSPGKTAPSISDALRVLNIAAGKITPTATDYLQGDIAPLDSNGKPKGDGVINTYDVIGILRMLVGLL